MFVRFHAVSCAEASPWRDQRAPPRLPSIPRAPLLVAGDPPRPVAGVCKVLYPLDTRRRTNSRDHMPATKAAWGVARPEVVEYKKAYGGETASWSSFFVMFPKIIFRYNGSVLPLIWFEVAFSVLLGTIAYGMTENGWICGREDIDCGNMALTKEMKRDDGHKIIGVLLSFLVVFRSQIAMGMYTEGRNHVGTIVASSRALALEILSSLAGTVVEELPMAVDGLLKQPALGSQRSSSGNGATAKQEDIGAPEPSVGSVMRSCPQMEAQRLATLALETVRLTKLFFFTVIEHVRSTDGEEAWTAAHSFVTSLATQAEVAELDAEFGGPQQGRKPVVVGGHGALQTSKEPKIVKDTSQKSLSKRDVHSGTNMKHRPSANLPAHLPELLRNALPYTARTGAQRRGPSGMTQDPTQAKPLLVLCWLRLVIDRLVRSGSFDSQERKTISELLHNLLEAYGGIDKIVRAASFEVLSNC